jgi:WD40 repeat protein
VAELGDLTPLMRAGTVLRTYMKRRAKHLPNIGRESKTVDLWSTDLTRLVAKFGHNLRSFTPSIFHIIPPLCPRESALYQQFGNSPRGIAVHGLASSAWDDRLACMAYENRETTALACGDAYFVIGTSDKQINLHYTSTCQLLATLPHEERLKLLEFDPSGRLLASAGHKRVRVWDVSSKSCTFEIQTTRPCLAMSFTQDGKKLILACQDNKLYFHTLDQTLSPRIVPWFMDFDHSEKILKQPDTAAFSLELKLFAFVYRGGHINLWNWDESDFTGTCEKPLASSQALPFHASSLAFSPVPGSDTLAAAYEGGDIYVFSPLKGSIKASYHVGHDAHTLAGSQDGRTLISGDSVGTIRVFDFINFEDQTLKMFYIIHGRGDNIRSLAFFGDGLRFVDIRGLQSNVWEPAALVRAEYGDEVSDTVSVDLQEHSLPSFTEIDAITAMAPQPAECSIFCGTEKGLLHAYSTETGDWVQTLYKHSAGIPVTRIIFKESTQYIATADASSRIIVRCLTMAAKWVVRSTLLDHRMNEPIEDLLFNPDGSRLLIVTTTQDTLCIFGLPGISSIPGSPRNKLISVQWTTRNWGIWTTHPTDPSQLLLTVNGRMRLYSWTDLHELSTDPGIEKDFELAPELEIQKVYSGWKRQALITEYSSVYRARAHIYLFVWETARIHTAEASIHPHALLQTYGTQIANLIGSSGKMIGVEREYLFFLDHEGWICSVKMELASVPEHYRRHLFLPSDWLSTSSDLLIACTAHGDIVFAKEHELAVIKNGLVYTELVHFQ